MADRLFRLGGIVGSLLMLASCTLVYYGVTAWILSRVARKAGSTRARFRVGALAVLVLVLLSVLCLMVLQFLPRDSTISAATAIGVFLVALSTPFVILHRIFRVNVKGTFAIYLAFVGVIAIQWVVSNYGVKRYLTEAFQMPTPTMSPTIGPTDRFLVNKLLSCQRWDLLVYWSAGASDPNPRPYCKRLIGLPGERLRFNQGNLYINDQPVSAPAVLAGGFHASADGRKGGYWKYADGETITLGANEFFMVGDNLPVSLDSRSNGPSDRSSIIGVVDAIYWPISRFKLLR